MAVQIPPLAFIALRYGVVAVAGFTAARMAPRGRFSRAVEAEMDDTPVGVRVRKDQDEAGTDVSGSARFIKNWRAGRFGPRLRIDGTALARLRIRRLT